MNIQTDTKRLEQTAHHFPAPPEEPIRDLYLHEDRLRALGESLARKEITSLFGLTTFDFQTRIRENAAKILDVYRSTNAAQARGETDHAGRAMAARQQLSRRGDDLPDQARPAAPLLPRTADDRRCRTAQRCRARWRSPGSMSPIPTARSRRRRSRRWSRAIQSVEPLKIGELWALPSLLRFVLIENLRRIAVRVERARARCARSPTRWPTRCWRRRRRRRRPQAAGGLCRACARHDLRHAAALPPARRLAECRQGADLAGRGAGAVRHRRRRDHHRRAPDAVERQRHHRQHHPRSAADQRRRLDGVVRGRQPRRRAAARTHRFRRARFRIARPVPRRDRGSGAALEAVRIRGRRDGDRTGRRRARPGEPMSADAEQRRCRLLPRRRAARRSWRRRSAIRPTSARRFNRAFRAAGWLGIVAAGLRC